MKQSNKGVRERIEWHANLVYVDYMVYVHIVVGGENS
jgi:hypothetical protein